MSTQPWPPKAGRPWLTLAPPSVILMRCACGAHEKILTSRVLAAGWHTREYQCGRCSERAEAELVDWQKLQAEPAGDALAAAL